MTIDLAIKWTMLTFYFVGILVLGLTLVRSWFQDRRMRRLWEEHDHQVRMALGALGFKEYMPKPDLKVIKDDDPNKGA